MRRMLSFVLCVFMILPICPVVAAETLTYFYDDFEGYQNAGSVYYGLPDGWTTDTFSQQGVDTTEVASYGNLVRENGGTVLKLGAVAHRLGTRGKLMKDWAFCGQMVIEFDFKTDELAGEKMISIGEIPLFRISAGNIVSPADAVLSRVQGGRWYHAAVQLSNGTCTVLLDGAQIGTWKVTQPIPGTARIAFGVNGSMFSAVTFYLDNVKLYNTDIVFTADQWNAYPPTARFVLDKTNALLTESSGGNSTLFSQPSIEEIKSAYLQNKPSGTPFLYGGEKRFAEIRAAVAKGGDAAELYRQVQAQAEQILEKPLLTYQLTGGDGYWLLDTALEAVDRVYALGLIYKVSGVQEYRIRLKEELKAISAFPTWQAYDPLATGALLEAVSVGYHWIYDTLTEEQKILMQTAVLQKGLYPLIWAYRAPDSTPTMAYHWVKGKNNWNMVVNGGVIMGALMMIEEEEELSLELLASAFRSLEYYISEYLPYGGSMEGIDYWSYAMKSFVPAMSACRDVLGTDFDYPVVEGLRDTVYFPIIINGKYNFNYHDSDESIPNDAVASYYANRLVSDGLNSYRIQRILSGASMALPQDLLWLDLGDGNESDVINLPLDKYFRNAETGAVRSSWTDGQGIVLAYHGGENDVNHGQLDKGTFSLEALGEKWAVDLGPDALTYAAGVEHDRYQLYRYRAEGHNTLVINPSVKGGQNLPAWNPVCEDFSSRQEAFSMIDLTQSYSPDAVCVKRGYKLTNGRRTAVVQDEISLRAAGELWWFFHTKADVAVDPSGKSAILRQNGKQLWIGVQSDANITFGVMPAEGLPTSVVDSRQESNADYQKLYVHAAQVQNATFTVTMQPIYDAETVCENIRMVPLSQWKDGRETGDDFSLNVVHENGKVTFYSTCLDTTGRYGKMTLVVGTYTQDNRLIGVAMKDVFISKGQTAEASLEVPAEAGGVYRAFLLDGLDTLRPLSGSKEYRVKET